MIRFQGNRFIRFTRIAVLVFALLCSQYSGMTGAFASEDTPSKLEFLGQFGGKITLGGIFGNYMLAGYGPRLVLFDVSNPAMPVMVDKFELLDDTVIDIVIEANLAYVALEHGYVLVYDISTPTSPLQLGSYNFEVELVEISVSDGYVYVLPRGSESFYILNATQPTHSVPLAPFDADLAYGRTILAGGGYLYVVDMDHGIQILDIHDPYNIQVTYSVQEYLIYDVEKMVLVGDRLFAVSGGGDGIRVFDVSDAENLQELDSYNPGGRFYDLAVMNSYAYIQARGDGLLVLRVNSVGGITKIGELEVDHTGIGMLLEGNRVYMVNTMGIKVVDVTYPEVPYLIGGIDLNTEYLLESFIDASNLVVVSLNGEEYSFQIDDPDDPQLLSVLDTPTTVLDVDRGGSYLYIAQLPEGVRIVDTSDPTNLQTTSVYTPPWPSIILEDIAVQGNYAYAASDEIGLVINVSDPAHPTHMSTFPVPEYGQSFVKVVGSYLYMSYRDASYQGVGLVIVDISSPNSPVEVNRIDQLGDIRDMASSNGVAYLGVDGGLTVMDLATPSAPVQIGSKSLPGLGVDVEVEDEYVYLVWYDRLKTRYHLAIINVSAPTKPVLVEDILIPGWFEGLEVNAGKVYISTNDAGVQIYQFNPPANLVTDIWLSVSPLVGVQPGMSASVSVRSGNSSTIPAEGVELMATIPAGVNYISDTSGVSPDVNGNVYAWALPDHLNGEETRFSITFGVSGEEYGDAYEIPFQLSCSTQELNLADNLDTSQIMVAHSAFLPILTR